MFNGKNILEVGNSNFNLLDDPALNAKMDKAEVVNDPASARRRGARSTRTITALAPGILWLWDTQPMLHAKDVNGGGQHRQRVLGSQLHVAQVI